MFSITPILIQVTLTPFNDRDTISNRKRTSNNGCDHKTYCNPAIYKIRLEKFELLRTLEGDTINNFFGTSYFS